MNIKKFSVLAICAILGFVSCKKDDDGIEVPVIEIRDRAAQQEDDMVAINEYLSTHYYNRSEFVGNSNPRISDFVITEITDEIISEDADSLLINAVGTPKTTVYEGVDYEFYILEINKGGGKTPTFADNIRYIYEGFTLDNAIFDQTFSPVASDLTPGSQTSLISGWGKAMPFFNAAANFEINNDGTVSYVDPGVGVMFLPSGLAYFSQSRPGIPSYHPICFKFVFYQTFQNDHDTDGIPSYLEDVNGNGELLIEDLTVADDDTDDDGAPDYLDTDDDGDGIPTRDELKSLTYTINTNTGEIEPDFKNSEIEFVLSRVDNEGVITIKTAKIVDSNNDGIGDYLDDTIFVRNSND